MIKKTLVVLSSFMLLAGCASQPAPTSDDGVKPQKAMVSNDSFVVYFDFDKDNIKSSQRNKITNQAKYFNSSPSKAVTIEGHTDFIGTREYNMALGERRANATKKALVSKNIDSSRIKVVSYGKDRPVDSGKSDKARAKNRRTVTSK